MLKIPQKLRYCPQSVSTCPQIIGKVGLLHIYYTLEDPFWQSMKLFIPSVFYADKASDEKDTTTLKQLSENYFNLIKSEGYQSNGNWRVEKKA